MSNEEKKEKEKRVLEKKKKRSGKLVRETKFLGKHIATFFKTSL